MLVNFRFKNYRSFWDENVLNMQTAKDDLFDEINTFKVNEELLPQDQGELIKSAIIFGANASGKSNVIKGMAYMVNAIQLSASVQFPMIKYNEHFSFYKNALKKDSLYEVEIIENNSFYRYGFIINNGQIAKEWLYKREKRETTVFLRDKDELTINGLNKSATALITIPATTLFLSIGLNYNLKIKQSIVDVISWFRKLLIVFENSENSMDIYTLENGKYRQQALEILKQADVGIVNMDIVKNKIVSNRDILAFNTQLQINPLALGQLKQEKGGIYNIDLQTTYNVYDDDDNKVSSKNVMLFKESGFSSEGTTRLLCYLGWILAALDQGRVIFIDEIDSKLHFLVADFILKLFNSIDKNPKNAQLICTAHNTLLMDDNLRRDQIYFTSKDKIGRSTLVSLSDFKSVRKNDLFSKKYLSGFYSDIPDMKGTMR